MARLQNYLTENEQINKAFKETLIDLQDIDLNEIYANPDMNQERIDESISVTLIISTILALPGLLKTIIKTFSFFYKKIKKLLGGKEESKVEKKLIEFADKWHHAYVNVLRQILRVGGVFKSAGIEEKEKQIKATEVVFYTIVFGLAVHGGITTAKGLLNVAKNLTDLSNLKLITFEGVLTTVKSKEVSSFIQKMMKT